MEQRKLGTNGPEVGAMALGCMSFAGFYGATDKAESFATLKRALDLGVTHLDTALLYGMGLSEEIIGEFCAANPNEFVIASKCGIVPKPQRHFNNKRDYIREAVEIGKAGLKVELPKDDLEYPAELVDRLNGDPDFRAAFEALTPGRQRGYVLHFSQPKQSATRVSRIDKAAPRILAGKGMHDR